jgi:hypothetical protein
MKQMKSIVLMLVAILVSQISFSQEFTIVVSPADSLRAAGDPNGAVSEFRKAYAKDPLNEINIYNYACTLAILGQKDSCFSYLYKSIALDTVTSALTDPDFISIKDDKRWSEFEDKLVAELSIKFHNPYKDLDYAKKLWRMQAKDQAYYNELDIAQQKTGMHSTVVMALWQLKHIYNEENQKELEKLIEEKGWPKISNVGNRAAGAAFLVIQHSDLEKQKRYLPTIEKLCKEKEASWQDYALMYDRIQVSENKPQKYGSQVKYDDKTKKYELFPLLDETKVDAWRNEIGMEPLADYVSHWDIKFEPKPKKK